LLSMLIAGAHALWGQRNLLAELKESELANASKTGIYICWHQMTMTLVVSGLGLICAALALPSVNSDVLAVYVLVLIVGNFAVFLAISVAKQRELLSRSAPQIAMFSILILLVALGRVF